ncbi:MAG: deoxyribodipyrimidine photo-lyase [Lentisphaerota bacterium]
MQSSISLPHKKSLFIFRRDLRLEDNTALIAALKESQSVIPAFIFDPKQADKAQNQYFSENAFGFMIESLKDLDARLKCIGSHLYIFHGLSEEVISELISKESITAVYINKDYTPFSRKRDIEIRTLCQRNTIAFNEFADALINEPQSALKKDNSPYTIFTPFWKNASKIPVKRPELNRLKNYCAQAISLEKHLLEYKDNSLRLKGGRANAFKLLEDVSSLESYVPDRDYPGIKGTSGLSAHLKFGTVSIREAYYGIADKLDVEHPLLRQFYWRDFFYHIAYHFPKVFGKSFHEKYEKVKWDYDTEKFSAWCEGKTGYPIVDAGMRELNSTGSMHNRVRIIAASFLTKDLHLDWRSGKKYFAHKLTDYDPSLNNGNWQWAASTGCDAQPYFRIFNPWNQQQKYDPECTYIKKWIPELRNLSPKQIHDSEHSSINGYPEPIVQHSLESKIAIERYKLTI